MSNETENSPAPTAELRSVVQYLPGLDGVRGLAILLVLIFHGVERDAGGSLIGDGVLAFARMGWVGVDLFFCLSGFLITGILLRTESSPDYFKTFYARRFLRIVPVYAVVLILFLHLLPAWKPDIAEMLWVNQEESPLWYWLYLSNILVSVRGEFAHLILGVAWSLAIEEQFYLVWPGLVRWLSAARLKRLVIAILVMGPLLRVAMMMVPMPRDTIYVFTLCRLGCMGAGAWLALAAHQSGIPGWIMQHLRAWLIAGLCLVAGCVVAVHFFEPWPGETIYLRSRTFQSIGYSAMVILSAAIVVHGSMPAGGGLVGRVLRSPPLRLLGKYSYGLYLLHLPVRFYLKRHHFQQGRIVDLRDGCTWPEQLLLWVVLIAASLAVAAASWHLFEAPILKLKSRFRYRANSSK